MNTNNFFHGSIKVLLTVTVLGCAVALAQGINSPPSGPSGETVSKVMEQPFTSPAQPVFDVLTIDLAPGATVPAHKHPGPVFAYVMEGELVTQIGTGPVETLKPGQTYYVPAGVVHVEAHNPSAIEHTKLLSIEVAPEGQPLVLPATRSGTRGQ